MTCLLNGLLILPNIDSDLIKVFVFGTLKQGFPNFYLNKGIKLNGDFVTNKAYLFYLMGERHSPCVIDNTNNEKNAEPISGELYLVTKDQLTVLDTLERINEANGYTRELITVINSKTDERVEAFIYLKFPQQIESTNIKVGPINCYRQEHANLYKPRH